MLTATLLGAFGTGTVVVGPLKQASDCSSSFQTSGEMYELPPAFCHHSDPASHVTSSIFELQAFKTLIIALTSSGPVPSPLITAAVFVKLQTRRFFRYLFLFACQLYSREHVFCEWRKFGQVVLDYVAVRIFSAIV